MKRHLLHGGARMALVAMVGLALAGGCRAPDTSALEAENRMLEDQLYELQDHCQQLHDELVSARRANASSQRDAVESDGSAPGELLPPSVEGMPELPSKRLGDEPRLRDATPAEPYLRAPESESEAPPYQAPSATPPPVDATPGTLPPFEEAPPAAEPRAQAWHGTDSEGEVELDSDQVVSITLNRRLTGGLNAPSGDGDNGVMVVVEPRTRDGRIVPIEGDVSIGLLDPELPAEQGRVARWDFSHDESAQFYRRTPMGDGLHFKLPWPGEPPQAETLKLWVRLTTPEGRKLLAQRTVHCDPEVEPAAFTDESSADEAVEEEAVDAEPVPAHRSATRPLWSPNRPQR